MNSQAVSSLNRVSLCICSYVKSPSTRRASIVQRAMQTWDQFLKLPFSEKIFLDDGSPDANGIRLLKLSNNVSQFSRIQYNTIPHPPHCNFGTLLSFSLCKEDYILHIDDDIFFASSYHDAQLFLERCIDVLDQDSSILGINLLTLPEGISPHWSPNRDYALDSSFAHPNEYFGTAASLIRRELLDKVTLAQVLEWGAQQPANWEELVSDNTSIFLIAKPKTPFEIDLDSWVVQSVTHGLSWRVIKHDIRKKISGLRGFSSAIQSTLKKE